VSSSIAHEPLLTVLLGAAEASKVIEGVDEDKITAEIEDLQHKLGDLQSNIDKVLQEVV